MKGKRVPHGKRILVTGGAGFIGSNLVKAVEGDNDVIVLDDLSSGTRDRIPDTVRFVEGDVRDDSILDEIGNVDIVFHEAALVDVDQSVEKPMSSHSRTATGTVSILEYGRRYDARVVLASSAAIYGKPSKVPIPETSSKAPQSPYGVDKLAADHYGRIYGDLYGLETSVLRYFNVFGPGQGSNQYSGVISTFLDQASAGRPLTVHGDGNQSRDFVYIDDVVRANLEAARTSHLGKAFNVGTGERTTINELAQMILDVTDSSSDITHVASRDGDIRQSAADISRMKQELGYEPHVSLRSGLETIWQHRTQEHISEH